MAREVERLTKRLMVYEKNEDKRKKYEELRA